MEKRRNYWFYVVALLITAALCLFLFGRNFPTKKITYGLMFDAGSTGSRIHVYSFAGNGGKLLHEIFEEVKPGLSGYDDPEQAAKSLQPLIDIALRSVPSHQHRCTPMALKATAGLRQMGAEKAERYLQAVRDFLGKFPFPMQTDGVAIMEGSDEGVFAWITVNYLLNRLDGSSSDGPRKTAAIMDLGGGSTQIVFEPNPTALDSAPAQHRYVLQYGKHKYVLYQNSYEGFGLMSARKKMFKEGIEGPSTTKASHPCVPVGHQETLVDGSTKVVLDPASEPSFEKCVGFAAKILHKEKECKANPCSFNGVFQPDITDPNVFGNDFYAFSYFYDRTQLDGPKPELTVGAISELGSNACSAKAADAKHGALCTDVAYIHALLTHGYGFKPEHKLKIAKKIDGYETAWALVLSYEFPGAMVTLMKNVNLSCESA